MKELPRRRRQPEGIISELQACRGQDIKWQTGNAWSLVFRADDVTTDLAREAYALFFSENALNPLAFPSLRKFETDVVSMTATLLGGNSQVVGNMTSGGTESLLMAVKTARDWGKSDHPEIATPNMIVPSSAHPAFAKAGHYFGVRHVQVPVGGDFRADIEAMRAAVTPDTILVVGSAPSYPHGVVDPIGEIASLAAEHDILCHVDACVGGLMLPFVRQLGYPVEPFDFAVEGVTSMSADLHKYGYAAKGASVILYRSPALRRYQYFATTDWSGGIYASPTMTGTRPGGAIASAWAVMHMLGQEGYLDLARTVMTTRDRLVDGIGQLDRISLVARPDMSILALAGVGVDIFEVADQLSEMGWHLDRQQFPPSIHLTVMPAHADVADRFLADLSVAAHRAGKLTASRISNVLQVKIARSAARLLPQSWVTRLTSKAASLLGRSIGTTDRSAAMYGMMATLPNRQDLDQLALDLLDRLTTGDNEEDAR